MLSLSAFFLIAFVSNRPNISAICESKHRETYIDKILGVLESEVLRGKDLGILDIVSSFQLLGLLAA